MTDNILDHYAAHELKYQLRKQVSQEIRKRCSDSDSDPMVTGITVMLGTVLAMAVFSTMLGSSSRGRGR
jgi:hypothetical protein